MAKLFQRQTALVVTQTGVTRQMRYTGSITAVFTFKGDTPFIPQSARKIQEINLPGQT